MNLLSKSRAPAKQPIPQRVLDRVFDNADVGGPDECWPWKLSIGSHGYGQACWGIAGGKSAGTTAHRVAWTAVNGPIPEGETLDHTCRNRPCINPGHLRLLSNVDNATDNGQGRKTHCPRGHAYSPDNTRTNGRGHRWCLTCQEATNKARTL